MPTFPDTFYLLDTGHPEYLDWRRARFEISEECTHLTVQVRHKTGGRNPYDLYHCGAFRGQIDLAFETILNHVFPPQNLHAEPRHSVLIAINRSYSVEAGNSPRMTFKLPKRDTEQLLSLSAHQRLCLFEAASIAAAMLKQKRISTPVR